MPADPADNTPAVSMPAASVPAVSVRGAHQHYGPIHAVDGISLTIERGEVFGLIGHNGAGKSTLFKMMLGLLTPTSGDIHIHGQPVNGKDFRAVRQHLGYLPENVVLWDNLTGLETLRFFARLKGVPPSDCAATLARVGLQDAAARPVRDYSKGMRQRLGFAQALLGQPRVLFLDEPTNGLDPHAIRAFYDTLASLREQGVTIVISSHILSELQTRVDRLVVLASGRIQALGSVQQLREQHPQPLTVRLRLAPAHVASAHSALAPFCAPGSAVQPLPDGLQLRCPRAAKLPLLQALAALPLIDVQIDEPSLEDIFFAHTAAEAA